MGLRIIAILFMWGCMPAHLWSCEEWCARDSEHKITMAEYVAKNPHSVSVVLGRPYQEDSILYFGGGNSLYMDKGLGPTPGYNCVPYDWRDEGFLEQAAPLVGKVSWLYVKTVPRKTLTKVSIFFNNVQYLLEPWGVVFYEPPKHARSDSVVLSFLKNIFEKVITIVDASLEPQVYRCEGPLLHKDMRDPLSVINIHKAFRPYVELWPRDDYGFTQQKCALILGRAEEGSLGREGRHPYTLTKTRRAIYLHPAGAQALDVGYGILFGWERAQDKRFHLPLSWTDSHLFEKLSPIQGKVERIYARPCEHMCDEKDLSVIELPRLFTLLKPSGSFTIEPAPRFVKAPAGATLESLNPLKGIPLFYSVPYPSEKTDDFLVATREARMAFLETILYPHIIAQMGHFFKEVKILRGVSATCLYEFTPGYGRKATPDLVEGLHFKGRR